MSVGLAVLIGAVIALAATVAACILFIPEKKRAGLGSPILVFLHDLCNFKVLLLEKILKVLYIFCTCLCVAGGFFMLFSKVDYGYYSRSFALPGLLLIILGPIAVRIVFESSMLLILGVNNIIQINGKMGGCADGTAAPEAPAAPETPAASPKAHFSPKSIFAPKAPKAPAAAPAAAETPAAAEAPVIPEAPAAPVSAPEEPASAICEQPDLLDPMAMVHAPAAPAAPAAEPRYVYCTECGTRYDANAGGCPHGCVPED